MIALPIISIVSCIAYIVFVLFKFGVPVSISETSYLLDSKWDWMFAAWTVLTAVPFGLYWFTVAVPGLKWMAEKMQELGVQEAFNLDGGNSLSLIFMGDIINRAPGNTNNRPITSVLGFGTME